VKIAVLSDIHGNFPAVETVTNHIEGWGADLVFVAGDIVNRGPRSLACLDFLLEKQKTDGWEIIRGNHEEYVISRADPKDPKDGPIYELFQPVHHTYQQLNFDVSELENLPTRISKPSQDYGEVRMVHASMRSDRDGIYPETGEAELKRQIAPAPAVFVTGHTHRPVVRTLNGSLIVNAGSAGLPFDGDTRPSYAQITRIGNHWKAEIIRLEYDINQAEKDFYGTGYLGGAGPLAQLVLLELKSGHSQLYQWTQKYAKAVLKGAITVEAAVREFLGDQIFKP
jgi:putative phosphoesterase